jgi:membrane dipeptidase
VLDSIWPGTNFAETPEMYKSLCWTNWPLITVGLVMKGYSDEDIQKIIGLNVLRVTKEVLTEF